MLLHISTCKKDELAGLSVSNSRYAMPVPELIKQATIDRLMLASEHLRIGDHMIATNMYRASIGRNYYAMYHAARAVAFASHGGDDHERHRHLPRNLPAALPDRPSREIELIDARLLRNQADYDPYPLNDVEWIEDARSLASTAAMFVNACETFANEGGLI